MEVKHVKGKKKGRIMMYALSTYGWCRKTKHLLNKLGVEYHYVDADLLQGKDRSKAMGEVERWNPRCTFPTLLVGDRSIAGYKEEETKEAYLVTKTQETL